MCQIFRIRYESAGQFFDLACYFVRNALFPSVGVSRFTRSKHCFRPAKCNVDQWQSSRSSIPMTSASIRTVVPKFTAAKLPTFGVTERRRTRQTQQRADLGETDPLQLVQNCCSYLPR